MTSLVKGIELVDFRIDRQLISNAFRKVFIGKNEDLISLLFKFCSGEELRRVEITSQYFRKFFKSNEANWLWHQPFNVTYTHKLPYKKIYLLFKVHVYRLPKSPRIVPQSVYTFLMSNNYHKKPKQFIAKCPCNNCLINEEELVAALFAQFKDNVDFVQIFKQHGKNLRGIYSETGNRILYCKTCKETVPTFHEGRVSGNRFISHEDPKPYKTRILDIGHGMP